MCSETLGKSKKKKLRKRKSSKEKKNIKSILHAINKVFNKESANEKVLTVQKLSKYKVVGITKINTNFLNCKLHSKC